MKIIKNRFLKISVNKTINDAIFYLEKSSLKTLFVENNEKKFIGSITDGDIRRGLLKGISLTDKVKLITNKKAKFLYSDEIYFDKFNLSYDDAINLIPVISRKTKKILNIRKANLNFKDKKFKATVLIMAGGIGERLMPLTKNCPKPLLKVKGVPILERLIMNFKQQGFNEFIISINYLGYKIKRYFENGKKLGVKISYIEEKKFLGTAGSFKLLNPKKKLSENVIVINGDIHTAINYSDLINFHEDNKGFATIVCRSKELHFPFGIVENKGKKLLSFKEKPKYKQLINAGIYCLNLGTKKFIKTNERLDMPNLLLRLKSKKKNILVYPLIEQWDDLGSIEIFNSYNN